MINIYKTCTLIYRTVTNLPPPSRRVEEYDADTEVIATSTSSGTSEENRTEENAVVNVDGDTDNTSTPELSSRPGKKKTKSRGQIEREELADRIINFANKEDHPVDLQLAALSSKIKRKLPNPDDQDDLLDEINEVARSFFSRKRRAAELSTVSTVPQTRPTTTTTMTSELPNIPPPPLQWNGREQHPQQQQQQQHGGGDVLNYLTDATSGATYMAL